MTFMRKILDAFNMENWQSNSILGNSHKTIDLYHIRKFWRSNRQIYQDDFHEASIKEYLLYGKTLMLWLFEKASTLKNDFPVYFERECHISNPKKLQDQLLRDGYIEHAPLKLILSSYKMQELKIIADSIGCSKNGKKSELVDRIYKGLDSNSVNTILSKNDTYILSEKGRQFLQENYDYVELHRHSNYDISLYDFNKNRFPDKHRRTFEDNVYTLVSQRIYKNCNRRLYHMMEYDYMILYNIALSEHEYDIALDCCLRSIYLKSCCMQIAQYYSTDYCYLNTDFKHKIIFTTKTALPIIQLGTFYDYSFIENIYKDLSLPPSFLSEKEFSDMVSAMIENTTFDYKKYNEIIISRLEKYSKLK